MARLQRRGYSEKVASCNSEAAIGDDEATMVRLQAPTTRLLPDDGEATTARLQPAMVRLLPDDDGWVCVHGSIPWCNHRMWMLQPRAVVRRSATTWLQRRRVARQVF